MTIVNFQFLLHYVLIICIEKFDETKAQVRYESYENRSVPNARQIYYTTRLSRGTPSSTDLPVAFKAPDFTSQNYWNYHHRNHSARRTFLGDLGYFGYRKPNLNSFYEFMNSFIDKGNIFKEPRPVGSNPVQEPYPYDYPYKVYSSTERNFLPPPKPIRASIVKLETVTRGPEAFIYVDPPRHQPNFRPIPTRKPNLNGFHIDELGFNSGHNINFESEFHSYPPITEGKSHILDNLNSTVYMLSSAQVNFQKVQMPFANGDERAPSTHSQLSQIASTAGNIMNHSEREPNSDTTNTESVPRFKHDKSKRNFSDEETVSRESKNDTFFKYKKLENDTAAINVSEESIINKTKAVKNIKPDRITNPIKIVTELTLEGLSKNKTEMVNIPTYTKFINMSGLINYELDKLKQNKIIKPRWDVAGEKNTNESSAVDQNHFLPPPVNSNDELSLDVKILKDTNWDGFTTGISFTGITETDSIKFNSTDGYGKWNKQFFTPDENHFLNANSSDIQNNAKNEKTVRRQHGNNTIIVETRVTKSISKMIPSSRNRKLYSNDTQSRDYFISTNQKNSQRKNFKNEKSDGSYGSEGNEERKGNFDDEEEKNYPLIAAMNPEYSEIYNLSHPINPSIQFHEKSINMYQEKYQDIVRDFNRTESVNPITLTIHEPKPILDNFFNIDKTRLPVPHNMYNADVVDVKKNTDSSLENFNNYTIYSSTSRGEPMILENKTNGEIIKQVRKRKHKRVQKNKRRRMGKRKQSSSITTEVNNANNHNVSQQTNNNNR